MSTAQKMLYFAEKNTTVLNRTNKLEKKKKKTCTAHFRHDPMLWLSDSQFVASTF